MKATRKGSWRNSFETDFDQYVAPFLINQASVYLITKLYTNVDVLFMLFGCYRIDSKKTANINRN